MMMVIVLLLPGKIIGCGAGKSSRQAHRDCAAFGERSPHPHSDIRQKIFWQNSFPIQLLDPARSSDAA
jgi:hypothetical protein